MNSTPSRTLELAGWALLGMALLVFVIAPLSSGRGDWPDLLPREATYLMQASSLAEDFDLAYSRLDFDRILLGWRGNPPDLLLASGSGGKEITFDRPAAYALWLAPFVKVAPERGFVLANGLLLALALTAGGLALRSTVGAFSPWLLLVILLASPLFLAIGRVDGDLFAAALTLLAMAAVLSLDGWPERPAWRLAGAGALLAVLALGDPLALLLLPLAIAVLPAETRWAGAGRLLAGVIAGGLALVLIHWLAGGGLYLTATTRFKFTPDTGYPLVDFAADAWTQELKTLAALHWDGAPRFSWGLEPWLAGWNALYVLAGRHFGLLLYAAPLLAGLLIAQGSRRRAFLLVLGAWALGLMLWHPFNLAGLPGPLGNRSALLWLAASVVLWQDASWTRGLRATAGALAGALALGAVFLVPAWLAPAAWPFTATGYRHLAPAAAWLPFEASQRWLYRAPLQQHQGLFIAPESEELWVEAQRDRLMIAGQRTSFLVVSAADLRRLDFHFGAEVEGMPKLTGGQPGDRLLGGDGRITLALLPDAPRRHALWLGPKVMALYRFEIDLGKKPAKPIALTLRAERAEDP